MVPLWLRRLIGTSKRLLVLPYMFGQKEGHAIAPCTLGVDVSLSGSFRFLATVPLIFIVVDDSLNRNVQKIMHNLEINPSFSYPSWSIHSPQSPARPRTEQKSKTVYRPVTRAGHIGSRLSSRGGGLQSQGPFLSSPHAEMPNNHSPSGHALEIQASLPIPQRSLQSRQLPTRGSISRPKVYDQEFSLSIPVLDKRYASQRSRLILSTEEAVAQATLSYVFDSL